MLTVRALPKTLTDNGITASQFDAGETSRLGGHGKSELPEPSATRGARAESSTHAAVSQSPPEKPVSSNMPVVRAEPVRSEYTDATKRFVPPTGAASEIPHSSMLHTTFVEDIEASLESWARERGGSYSG